MIGLFTGALLLGVDISLSEWVLEDPNDKVVVQIIPNISGCQAYSVDPSR